MPANDWQKPEVTLSQLTRDIRIEGSVIRLIGYPRPLNATGARMLAEALAVAAHHAEVNERTASRNALNPPENVP